MDDERLESQVKTLQDQVETLSNQVETLTSQLNRLQDIEEIKKLQRIYGFYLEHWMFQEIVDLFADSPDAAFDSFPGSTYYGKTGVVRYFGHYKESHPEFLHQLMQVQPVIDVAPDGKTAKGRWYGYGPLAIPSGKGVRESLHSGTYENEYIKENGKWKLLKIRWKLNYIAEPGIGLVKPDRAAAADPVFKINAPEPDTPRKELDARYPSGYIFPFHYKHPITESDSSEGIRNASVKGVKGYEKAYEIHP